MFSEDTMHQGMQWNQISEEGIFITWEKLSLFCLRQFSFLSKISAQPHLWNYAYSSWRKKTMPETMHCRWDCGFVLRRGQTHQNCNATSCSIGRSCSQMLCRRSWPNACNISQHPKMLQQKFDQFQTWPSTIQHLAIRCCTVTKRVQNVVAQQCCKILRWRVACVWLGI